MTGAGDNVAAPEGRVREAVVRVQEDEGRGLGQRGVNGVQVRLVQAVA